MGHRIATYAMVTAGGSAALSWEVLWQLQASWSIGASAQAAAIVLSAAMTGMALGSVIVGHRLRDGRARRPIALYGWLELAIGASGAAMLPGFALLDALDARIFAIAPSVAPAIDFLGIGILVFPAAFAMGATVPIFQLIASATGARISVLYGSNTLGAGLGVLVLSGLVIPALGITKSVLLICSINALVFIASRLPFWGSQAPTVTEAVRLEGAARPSMPFPAASFLVFGTGVATFALEIAWFRTMRAAFQTTTDTFAILLAAVLIPLALAARCVSWLRRRGASLPAIILTAGILVVLTTPLIERMDLVSPDGDDFWARAMMRFLLSLAVLGPAMFLIGIALPWVLEEFRDPSRTGRIYALNTAGAVVGSLGAAWLLLPGFGFAYTAWGVGAGIAALSLLTSRDSRWATRATSAVLIAIAIAAGSRSGLGRDRVQGVEPYGPYRILAFEEGPDATFSVIETSSGRRHLVIDGFLATSEFSAADYMEWMGRLPMMLHDDPENALVICFGTGRTADAVRQEEASRIDVVDINQAVLDLAPLFPSNNGVLEDPRVRSVAMDGRRWLRRTEQVYDVITLEPMPPNFAGMNSLYSREFYEAAAQRLAPDGIIAQWLPIHLVSAHHAASIAATFRDAFPDAVLWIDPHYPIGVLLGRREPGYPPLGAEWPGFARDEIQRPRSDDEIARAIALHPGELARYAQGGEVITDDNQLLSYTSLDPPRGPGRKSIRNLRRIAEAAGSYPYVEAPDSAEIEIR